MSATKQQIPEALHIISLGAGVQSSTMALMAACGELEPTPSCAIFADTQQEPKAVYDWLATIEPLLPFPVHHVTAGDLIAETLKPRQSRDGSVTYQRNYIPAFTLDNAGNQGMIRRSCTREFKIAPIQRKQRSLMRAAGATKVISWIGISLDEVIRMKPSRVKYIEHRHPLIDLRMTRADCLQWMKRHGFPTPPKSACSFCPYRSDQGWRELKLYDKAAFDSAVQLERDWNAAIANDKRPTQLRGRVYLHRSLQPLDQVDFRNLSDFGQGDLFGNECEGMCGV